MGVGNSDEDDGPNGEKMSDYKLDNWWNPLDRIWYPWKHALPSCEIKLWKEQQRTKCITGGERWMCKGYKTETPGQLN